MMENNASQALLEGDGYIVCWTMDAAPVIGEVRTMVKGDAIEGAKVVCVGSATKDEWIAQRIRIGDGILAPLYASFYKAVAE